MRSVRAWGEVESESVVELLEAPPEPPPEPVVRQRAGRGGSTDVFGVARCPRCHVELVARMGREGPCFPCRCPRRS